MSDNIELQEVRDNTYNNKVSNENNNVETAGNGACPTAAGNAENEPLLSQRNGEDRVVSIPDGPSPGSHAVSCDPRADNHSQKESAVVKVKQELMERVYRGVRLWMVLLVIFILIILVIGLSFLLCRVMHKDVDDNFDVSSFVEHLSFRGSFSLRNENFTSSDVFNPTNSAALFAQLKQKLDEIYQSSPALSRYFSSAWIHTFRHGDATSQYQLNFRMPVDHALLVRFTLSREMVYNVFLQQLYDQDPESGDPLQIDPATLNMEVGSWEE